MRVRVGNRRSRGLSKSRSLPLAAKTLEPSRLRAWEFQRSPPTLSLGYEELAGPHGARGRVESAQLAAQRLVLSRHADVDDAVRDEGRGPGEGVGRVVHRMAPADGARLRVEGVEGGIAAADVDRPVDDGGGGADPDVARKRGVPDVGAPHDRARSRVEAEVVRAGAHAASDVDATAGHDRAARRGQVPHADERPESRREMGHVGDADRRVALVVVGAGRVVAVHRPVGRRRPGRWRCRPLPVSSLRHTHRRRGPTRRRESRSLESMRRIIHDLRKIRSPRSPVRRPGRGSVD